LVVAAAGVGVVASPFVAAEAAPTLVSDPGHEAAAALERFTEGRPVLTKPTSSLAQCGIRPPPVTLERDRPFADSSVEESGFEPLVPLKRGRALSLR
jgi:hypothetical protein